MIRTLVPQMPKAEALMPYLKRIDDARWYSNFGQLVKELEERLEDKYQAHVVTVSSCTAGLELCYELHSAHKIKLPSLTFVATILAADRAGLQIEFADVDPDTWITEGVSGFGLPSTGRILDAAAAFGEQEVPNGTTAVFSLHATKIVGAGEGGYIVTHDPEEARELRRLTTFGLENGVSVDYGTNAKMSEYHAAVALASLDAYSREPWLRLFDMYDKHLPACVIKQKRPRGVYPILSVKLPCDAVQVQAYLKERDIETRRWYVPPMHKHPKFIRDASLPVTDDLEKHLIGLPWHLHLTELGVHNVCANLEKAIELSKH